MPARTFVARARELGPASASLPTFLLTSAYAMSFSQPTVLLLYTYTLFCIHRLTRTPPRCARACLKAPGSTLLLLTGLSWVGSYCRTLPRMVLAGLTLACCTQASSGFDDSRWFSWCFVVVWRVGFYCCTYLTSARCSSTHTLLLDCTARGPSQQHCWVPSGVS